MRPRSIPRQPLLVRRRMDLHAVKTRHKTDVAIVVKDPVAMKYHRLREDEYFVLQQLDGRVSLEELCSRYEKAFPPNQVSHSMMNRLLLLFHRSGLTIADSASQGDRLHERMQKERMNRWIQQLSGILVIRFPGIDPEPVLRCLYPLSRPWFTPVGLACAMVFCLIACSMFLIHGDRFWSEFPSLQQWLRVDSILVLALVIGLTKVLHEFGHAFACKHFGGECHQIGPMLLVFTPALYCDTSDSWMLPNRWHRATVGMAGIVTEVFLAALATFVWSFTAPGMIHYAAMNVMLVCSVGTLLVNANPLLRYDGYYVLSDLVAIPNLAEESKKLLFAKLRRWLLGVTEDPLRTHSRSAVFWMCLYAVLAICYRWVICFFIIWCLANVLRPWGLESIGLLLCALVVLGLLYSTLKSPFEFLRHPLQRRSIRFSRMMASACLLGGLLIICFWPMPSSVSARGHLVPVSETPVYASTPGLLERVEAMSGQMVAEGTPLVKLVNHDVELQFLSAKGRYEAQLRLVKAMTRSSIAQPELSNELPSQRDMLEEFREQMLVREQRRDGLLVSAPKSGMLINAPRTPRITDRDGGLPNWNGYPTDPENHRCFVNQGDELFSLIDPDNWEVELQLDQVDIERVAVGDSVKIMIDAEPNRITTGVVREISRAEWGRRESADRRDENTTEKPDTRWSTLYAVRVSLDSRPIATITGLSVSGRIGTGPVSIADRLLRWICGLLRFQ